MPDKFPLEHFNRNHHPDAWFECWQDNDFYFGHLDTPAEPTDEYLNSVPDYDLGISDLGWPDQDLGESPYSHF